MSVLIATLAVALIFMGVGWLVEYLTIRRIAAGLAAPAYALVTGWAAATFVCTLAALSRAHLTVPLLLVAIAGLAGLLLAHREIGRAAPLLGAFALALPLMWIASHVAPTMFDEFTHWLPNARYLIAHDAFPHLARDNIWSVEPGYPPAVALVSYAVERISGSGFEIAPKPFVVMLAAAFGLLLADVLTRRHGPVLSVAVGVACATILNPFFDSRLALSTYADVPTGLVLAVCVAAYWSAVEEDNLHRWWRPVAPTVLLLLLRETSIVLVAGLGLGLLLLGRRAWRALGLLAISAVAAFGLWRLYLLSADIPPGLAPRPLADWDWSAPLTVARVMITDRLSRNPLLGGMALVIIAALSVAVPLVLLRLRDMKLRRLALICASVAVVWTAFLAWCYIAVFPWHEVSIAGSTWRFLSELGPMLIYAAFIVYAVAWANGSEPRAHGGTRSRLVAALLCLLVPASMLVTWRHWRFDCRYADVAAARSLVGPLTSAKLGNTALAVVHPTDASYYAIVLDYGLGRPAGTSVAMTRRPDAAQPYLLDLSVIDREALVKGGIRPAFTLMRRDGDHWRPVLAIPSAPLPACRLAG